MSLDTIARSAINVLQANPKVAGQLGWDLSLPAMMDRVDEFNAALCAQMGHGDYILADQGGQPDLGPFSGPGTPAGNRNNPVLKNVVAGSNTLVEWIASGAEAVQASQASGRASVCAACPHNEKGGLERFFTLPVSAAIRAAYNAKRQMQLATPSDEALNVCGICNCPLKLKVHVPLAAIIKRLPENVFAQLPGTCWIRTESAK